jgi:hypothetical protein
MIVGPGIYTVVEAYAIYLCWFLSNLSLWDGARVSTRDKHDSCFLLDRGVEFILFNWLGHGIETSFTFFTPSDCVDP